MKRLLGVLALAGSAAFIAQAADMTGYIVDKSCAKSKDMWGDSACVARCLGRGDAAVFVTEDGKIYSVAAQDKVKSFGGKKVTVTGKVTGDAIEVEKIAAKAD
jgi:hypothetical protein